MVLKLRVYKSHNNPLNYFGSFVLLGTLVAFFGFHSLAGERGLLVLDNLDRKIASAQEHLYLLEKKNAEIEATEIKQKIRLVRERIDNRYGANVPKNMVIDSTEEQIELEK